ncbi:MAG TPA: DUF6345 domain-containing protein [Thermoanaerobaculia bacterium]|nr:DUF6345 domain-containing protein [Thermoanaerobaculia bacterium]
MKPNTIRCLLPAVCFLILCAASAQADPREAKLYVITNWPSSGTCKGNDVAAWDDMALGWYDQITAGPEYFKDGVWNNGNLSRRVLCDPDSGQTPCDDWKRIDDADAAMIALHGTDVGKHWAGLTQVQSGSDCLIHAAEGASTDALFVGDGDLEFLHLSSCFSMDDDNLNSTWRLFADVDSPSTGNRLHQADGFHGVMAISAGRTGDYADFADDAHWISIADAWTDNLYDEDITYNNGKTGDQCPVAYAVSNVFGDALTRLIFERYNFVFPDPAGNNYIAYQFYDGCDPVGETPFDDPND